MKQSVFTQPRSLADIPLIPSNVRFTPESGPYRLDPNRSRRCVIEITTFFAAVHMSAFGADMPSTDFDVRY
jgi:hypothetical protein